MENICVTEGARIKAGVWILSSALKEIEDLRVGKGKKNTNMAME